MLSRYLNRHTLCFCFCFYFRSFGLSLCLTVFNLNRNTTSAAHTHESTNSENRSSEPHRVKAGCSVVCSVVNELCCGVSCRRLIFLWPLHLLLLSAAVRHQVLNLSHFLEAADTKHKHTGWARDDTTSTASETHTDTHTHRYTHIHAHTHTHRYRPPAAAIA